MQTETQKSDKCFTFKVEDVKVCEKAPRLAPAAFLMQDIIGRYYKSEDNSHRNSKGEMKHISGRLHGFANAVHTAYAYHYPLQLSVSDFIILIGQGLSRHIDNNSEKLRKFFVNHEGKETITVRRDEFVLGQQNDWSSAFGEFAEEIKKRVKTDIHDIVIDDTSVATATTRIVSEITLMDCMKDYFGYRMLCGCGIPEITLKGTPEDWEKLRGKVHKLVEMNRGDCLDLDWWLKRLVPVMEKICDTGAKKEVDKEFWSGIYKYKEAYMVYIISGWITVLFPYISASGGSYGVKQKRNPFDVTLGSGQILQQISEVPLVWEIEEKKFQMKICSGFLGAKFSKKKFRVSPDVFWSVVHAEEDEELKAESKRQMEARLASFRQKNTQGK